MYNNKFKGQFHSHLSVENVLLAIYNLVMAKKTKICTYDERKFKTKMRKMQHLTSNENVDNQYIDKNVIYTKNDHQFYV